MCAVKDFSIHMVNRDVGEVVINSGGFCRELTSSRQLCWDAKELLFSMNFRYITDVLTGEEAYEQQMLKSGYLAYTRSCAWLDYSGQRLKQMLDANQQWEIKKEWVTKLAELKASWIKEPAFPDEDMHFQMGHTLGLNFLFFSLHHHNRVIFKQLQQAKALSYLQIDSCRLGSVNENLSVLLMTKNMNCGLCELVQHLVVFDYTPVSESLESCKDNFAANRNKLEITWVTKVSLRVENIEGVGI
ncbi:PREDICTED: mitochondrial enolase superfamily member 1 [Apaloderma vittatum]|uniref:mitochondrial enolase superfamily member 1 n=1 Tax=Apaloderma vittatum TaxID=57397 RepID=UPI0005219929|nr:PREDICTED: mitochondrial enolase superfamily member 1 [Apaloderma vittatum]